jgi:hypothetical protein
MPMDGMSMRHVREGVRLTNSPMTTRDIARRVGVASWTIRRCEAAGIAGNTQAENRCHEIRRRAENKAAKVYDSGEKAKGVRVDGPEKGGQHRQSEVATIEKASRRDEAGK